MMKNNWKIAILLAGTILLSCTREDRSQCPEYCKVKFYYTLNQSGENQLSESMDSITLLIYDNQQRLFSVDHIIDNQLYNDTYIALPQGGGTLYSIGGDFSAHTLYDIHKGSTITIGQTTLTDTRTELNLNENGTPLSVATELFLGASQPIEDGKEYSIGMVSHQKDIVLKMVGSATAFDCTMKIQNGSIDHQLSADTTRGTVTHHVESEMIGDTMVYNHSTMRLYSADTTATIILNTPTRALDNSIPLIPTIMKNPNYNTQEDLDREDRFEIVLSDTLGVVTVVSINDWEVVDVSVK